MKSNNVAKLLIPLMERSNPDVTIVEWKVNDDTLFIKADYNNMFTYEGECSLKQSGLYILNAFNEFTDEIINEYWERISDLINRGGLQK